MPEEWSPGPILPEANFALYGEIIAKVTDADSHGLDNELDTLARLVAINRYWDRVKLSQQGFSRRRKMSVGDDYGDEEEGVSQLPNIDLIARMNTGHGVAMMEPQDDSQREIIIKQAGERNESLQPVEAIHLLAAGLESVECGRLTHLFDFAEDNRTEAIKCLEQSINYFRGDLSQEPDTYRIKDKDIGEDVKRSLRDVKMSDSYACRVVERIHKIGQITLENGDVVECRLRTSYILPLADELLMGVDLSTLMTEFLKRADINLLVPVSSTAYIFNREVSSQYE
jgi:hypothetical protein